jgi:MFS family permease
VSERHRGTLSGFYSLTWSVGYSIGPITAGWLQEHIGLSTSFIIGAVCVGLSATLLRFFFSREERTPKKSHA